MGIDLLRCLRVLAFFCFGVCVGGGVAGAFALSVIVLSRETNGSTQLRYEGPQQLQPHKLGKTRLDSAKSTSHMVFGVGTLALRGRG